MSKITSIDELIECFDEAEPSEQISVLKRIDIPTSEFENFATWKENGYTRNCLARNDDFEFILICWSIGARTPIHGHAGQDCWVYQVQGNVTEKRFSESDTGFDVVNEAVLTEGRITYMHDRMGYHSIENFTDKIAMTLHIYASPIDRCKVYNEEKSQFEIRELDYHSIKGKEVTLTGN
ncbi:MAG: cysteine dioxygenase family protein [Flavobacteriales bacterium]|nr:cysteine dioxygenase family protein [Flavobacteriales bacterium]